MPRAFADPRGLNFTGSKTINLSDSGGQYNAIPAISVTTLPTSSSPLDLYVTNIPAGSGTIEILKYSSGAIGGSGSGAFHLASPANSGTATYSLSASGGYLDLMYTFGSSIYWTGSGSTSWDTVSTNNWNSSTSNLAATYLDGDSVVFDNRAASSTPLVAVNSGNVSPASVTFSNSGAVTYTLTGSSRHYRQRGADGQRRRAGDDRQFQRLHGRHDRR